MSQTRLCTIEASRKGENVGREALLLFPALRLFFATDGVVLENAGFLEFC